MVVPYTNARTQPGERDESLAIPDDFQTHAVVVERRGRTGQDTQQRGRKTADLPQVDDT